VDAFTRARRTIPSTPQMWRSWVLLGTLAGALTPGGPFTHFPILGAQVAVARIGASLWVPPVVGWIGAALYQVVHRA